MSYNPLQDYKEFSSLPDRPERRIPCERCKAHITLQPPTPGICFACWAGHPAITKPTFNLSKHPHYLATAARLQAKADKKAVAVAA